MKDYESLSHTKWDCKYHVVIVPKYRKKVLYGQVKKELRKILHELSRQKGVKIEEGHLSADHIHMMLKIPPKYSVSMIIGFLKGKSAIKLNQKYGGIYKHHNEKSFWSRGYYVSTVGLEEAIVKKYIKNQETKDKAEFRGRQLDLNWQ